MKLTQLTVAAMCLTMAFVACQKDTHLPATKKPVTATEKAEEDPISLFFKANQTQNAQTFQFDATTGTVFTGTDGTVVTVQGSALKHLDGTIATGPVVARLIEVKNLAQQMTMGFPTQNRWSPNNPNGGGPIQTAGALELTISTTGGQQLTATGNGVTIGLPIPGGTAFDNGMRIWKGAPSLDQPRDNVWIENPNEVPQGGGEMGQLYLFNWEGRQRLNCDKLYATCPGTPTPFKVDLPPPFDKSNTEIFVVTQVCGSTGPKAVFALDMYNPSPKYWYEHTAAGLPVGLNVDFVAIAKVNGQLYYKIENATIVPNHFQHMNGMMLTNMATLTANLLAL